MEEIIKQLPHYQKKRIAESGITPERLQVLYNTINQAWPSIAKRPFSEGPKELQKLGMTQEESKVSLLTYFNLRLKLKENGNTC